MPSLAIRNPESLDQRLSAVSRELRWHRRAWMALAVLGGAVALAGARAGTSAKDLRASRIVLTDSSGAERGALGVEPDGSVGLRLRDVSGSERLAAVVGANGPSLALFEPDRKLAARILVEGGIPRFSLSDRTGSDRLWIALRLGSPALQFLDSGGVARTGLVTMNDDRGIAVVSDATGSTPGLILYDKDRKVVWSAP